MKLRIFALAFSVAFVFCFSAASFFVIGFKKPLAEEAPEESPEVFLEEEKAVFLLVYKNREKYGPFTLVALDAKVGRIPVFTFSEKAALDYGGVNVSAGDLFSSVSPKIFAGTVETNLGIELSGYFIWNRESCEEIIEKAGTFDYVLSKNLRGNCEEGKVNLIAGVQNMNGKKICDVVGFSGFSEGERCDVLSRMVAAFFNRRIKRFLPESAVYSAIFNYTETDVTAFDKQRYAKIIEVLSASKNSLAGHITNDTEKDLNTGLLYFSTETKNRVKKYFG